MDQEEVDDYAIILLGEAYDVLRRVERYGDWDEEFWEDAGKVKEKIGVYLWPSS